MVRSPPGSSVHGIPQARILEWVATSFSRGYSPLRDQTCVSCIGRQILYHWTTRETLISRKALNPFMVTPHDQQKTFCKVSAWFHWAPASPKSYMLTSPYSLFGAVSQSYLKCCLPGCSPHFAPNKTYCNSHVVHLFSRQFLLYISSGRAGIFVCFLSFFFCRALHP